MGTVDHRGLVTLTLADDWSALTPEHTARRIGEWGERAICTGCGTILVARHDTFLIPHEDHEHTVRGAYVAGDLSHPFLPFYPTDMTWCQDDTDEHSATDPAPEPKPRPAGISAAAVAKGKDRQHRRTIPSRSPEARHDEYVRAKRRARV